ncbi:hypothetical protein CLU83_0265 [Flavobacterium sp. 1]|nr:hypothetical protein CLU83_0265 [Flavobacterium sp. 1]
MDIFIAQMQFFQLDRCIILQYTDYQQYKIIVFVITFVQLQYFLITDLNEDVLQ